MLGPSGSGKTTTLRMIAGFELPTAGRILLHGTDVTGVPPFDRDVNTVFQDYALFPHMTVGENVAYGLVVRKVPRPSATRVSPRRCAMVRLEGYEKRQPGQLSGGQRQRVALARALVNRPRVLLLDEPLGALDLKLREEMQIELKEIQKEVGITFIYVTHDQEEALTMSDRLAVFNRGRIEQVGTPADVYEHPATTVRGRLRRDVEPADGRGRAGRHRAGRDLHRPAREDPDRRAPRRAGADEHRRSGRARSRLPRVLTRDTSLRSTPVASSSSPSRTCRHHPWRRLPPRAGRFGSSGSGSHVLSLAAGQATRAGDTRGSGSHMRQLRIPALSPWPVVLVRCCGGVLAAGSGRACSRARRGRGRAEPRHLGRLRRGWLGVSRVRLGDAIRGGDRLHRQRDGPWPTQPRACSCCSPASTTAARSPATPPTA